MLRRRKTPKKEMKFKKVNRLAIPLLLSVVVFAVTLLTLGVMALWVNLGDWMGLPTEKQGIFPQLLAIEGLSLIIGTVMAFLLGHFITRPINQTIEAIKQLANGNFDARLSFDKVLDEYQPLRELTESFNTMANDLKGTEMLRADFINNFSHEFKTPIVSINGFAGLLKQGGLSAQEEQEYLNIIEGESRRLANMATNVLNLTRLENQAILSDVTLFNLSEQLRHCALLLESKWSEKELELNIDISEHFIYGSKQLLEQVWVNLLDNAIKFSTKGGTLDVAAYEEGDQVSVSISNTGSTIPPEKRETIFRKFYQADSSHASEGNGIGLAIVKRVTELHGGTVSAESHGIRTVFTVTLPKGSKPDEI